MTNPSLKRSSYMEWAKTRSQARFNLATSGLMNVPFAEFPVRLEEFEITAADGYGYPSFAGAARASHRRAAGMHRDRQRHFDGEPSRDGRSARTRRRSPDRATNLRPLLDVAHYLRRAGANDCNAVSKTGFAVDLNELEKSC